MSANRSRRCEGHTHTSVKIPTSQPTHTTSLLLLSLSGLKSKTRNPALDENIYERVFRVLGPPWAPEQTTQGYLICHRHRKRQHNDTQSARGAGKNNARVLELPLASDKTTRTDLGERESTTQTTRGAGKENTRKKADVQYSMRQIHRKREAREDKRGAKYFDPL